MFEKRNTKICLKLAIREIWFHRARSFLTIVVAVLATALFSFVLFLSSSMKAGYEHQLRYDTNTLCDVLYTDITKEQAQLMADQGNVKEISWYQPVGTVSAGDSIFELSSYQADYAATVEAIPDHGRLPEKENEIAMDLATAYQLGNTNRVGDTITLQWVSENGESVEQTFTLVGTWQASMDTNIIWISDALAEKYPVPSDARNVTAGVMLYQTLDIKEKAQALAEAVGIQNASYITNLIYEDYQVGYVWHYIGPILSSEIVVFLCGLLMFYAIFQMSTDLDVRFYGRMKTMGMTPFQMRRIVYYWSSILVLCSMPLGWLLGYLLTETVYPVLISMNNNPVYPVLDFALSLLGVWLAVVLASLRPAFCVSRLTPVEAMSFPQEQVRKNSKKENGKHRRITLFRMALAGMFRQKGRMLFSIAALSVAVAYSCTALVQFFSFDKDIGLRHWNSYDCIISSATVNSTENFFATDDSLSAELYRDIASVVGEDQISRTYVSEVTSLPLDDALYQQILNYYDEEHLDYYSGNYLFPGFEDAYETMRETHSLPVVVYGIDSLMAEKQSDSLITYGNNYNEQDFMDGGYAFINGIRMNRTYPSTDYQPLPELGSTLNIFGKDFTVMGTGAEPAGYLACDPENPMTLQVYISAEEFLTLFPDSNLMEIVCNFPSEESKQKVTEIVTDYEQSTGYTLGFVLHKEALAENYDASCLEISMPKFILSAVLFLIGLIGFINLLFHRTLARSREFAVYRSLGMSRQELTKLLIIENLLFTIFVAVILYPVAALAAGPYMMYYYATGPEWAYTYHFTVLPAHLIFVALLVIAIIVPLFSLHFTERDSITHRLNLDE